MKIFGYELSKIEVQNNTSEPITIDYTPDGVEGFSLSKWTDLPYIKEERNRDWVTYGNDNLYPEYLKDMYNSSPTHQAIVKTKAQMVVGDGYTIQDNHLSEAEKINVLKIIQRIDKDLYETSMDYQLYGAMAYEIIWSLDFKRVVEVNRLDISKLRSGKFEDGSVKEWYYSRDWATQRPETVCIYTLNKGDKQNHRQILYKAGQMISNEYYGEPSYQASIDWVKLESQTGLYYSSLIENGFNPSVIVKFYRKPASLDERSQIVQGLKKSFGGVKNSGKAVVLFSDGKELAPDIQTVDVASVDKQFTVIADQIVQKILTGERVTTPELFGIQVPGSLGSSDFETKVRAFTRFVIRPDQIILEDTINEILKLNGYDVKFKFNQFTI